MYNATRNSMLTLATPISRNIPKFLYKEWACFCTIVQKAIDGTEEKIFCKILLKCIKDHIVRSKLASKTHFCPLWELEFWKYLDKRSAIRLFSSRNQKSKEVSFLAIVLKSLGL